MRPQRTPFLTRPRRHPGPSRAVLPTLGAARARGAARFAARAVLLATAAVALVLVGLPARPAAAHATLISTTPAADQQVDSLPEQVELRFDEPVEALQGAVRVFGPDGDRVDRAQVETAEGDTVVRAAIEGEAQGTYTVAWRVTSEDSHTLEGSFVFHVGSVTGAVEIDEGGGTVIDVVGGLGRWLGFAGTLAAAGAALLALVAGPGETGARARLGRYAAVVAAVGVAGVAVSFVATLADSSGRSFFSAIGLVPDLAWETRNGRLSVIRLALGLAVVATAAVGALWRRSPAPAAALALASLVTASLAGHAWTAPSRGVAVTADVVHLAAVALWLGGVAALLVALPVAGERHRLASRFSTLALGAVAVVVASGAVSSWQQVRALDALTSTGYGQLLLAKVLVFTPLLALGYVNRAHLVPLAVRTLAPLTRSLRAEVAVAAAVLALTASLIHQPPARSTVTEPYDATIAIDGGTLDATVEPARAGPNDLHLYFYDADGMAQLPVDAVQVTAATGGVPARRLDVTPISPNHVTVAGASLPSSGTWTIEVTAVSEGTPLVFTFEVPIR